MNENGAAVRVKNLAVAFGDFYAVDDISFSVQKGEIFGFLGANGAGKTTTIRVLCGLLEPTCGEAIIGGIKITDLSSEMAVKRKVGYMSQKFTLYDDLTVEENLAFIASLHQLEKETFLQRRNEILKFISFSRPLDSLIGNFAGGMKQQVALAAAMLHDPEIIFLDEPTAGVTPAMRARFWDLIRALAKQGKTIFVTTHYMDEAEQCERIALMRAGKIVALDSPKNLKGAAFPNKFYEFTPKAQEHYAHIRALKERPEFEYFEPFGLCFHAAFKQGVDAKQVLQELQKEFIAKELKPTLEDVFIKITAGKQS